MHYKAYLKNGITTVIVLFALSCASFYSPYKSQQMKSDHSIKGNYALHNSNSGYQCKLWIGTPDLGEHHFYLEFGFYGDDGGKTTAYEGYYSIENNTITLAASREIKKEWDASINYEHTEENSAAKKITGKILTDNNGIAIAINLSGKAHRLTKNKNE
jgi:hypothetical protein